MQRRSLIRAGIVIGAIGLIAIGFVRSAPSVSAQQPTPTLPPRPSLEPTLPPRPTLPPTLPPRPTLPPPTLPPRPTLEPTSSPTSVPQPPPTEKPEQPQPTATPTMPPALLPQTGDAGADIALLILIWSGLMVLLSLPNRKRTRSAG